MSLSPWPLNVVNTTLMCNKDQITLRLPVLQDKIRGHSVDAHFQNGAVRMSHSLLG